jgi:four helix bundle protein
MDSYRDLEIYHESRKLGIEIHLMSLTLPKFELYEVGSQIRRSSKSVTAMIVEGFARRRYKADYIKYLVYSIAECDETLVHLDYLHDTKSLNNETVYEELRTGFVHLSKKINKYTQWVEDKFIWKPDTRA